ncbi:uncharacterized protein MELLADRAFT_74566 [Melampsora larici-populina 98AG31]|uniref:HotDog ACOT-type domain-containing protein n=1 Tax=Melampsora larici-populina (strain 98AG31 / pathotype 3-4-7) TaxID=747676 RepID=F4RGZ6_MELLP|nr:uncharacterized protein MELLADRAFT_74566 [Melampsora larici-populina 98AG31]EGG08323.1 hypothetical protein MELLADRAFT_74566 [Melampsora larici-populina 98AG31]
MSLQHTNGGTVPSSHEALGDTGPKTSLAQLDSEPIDFKNEKCLSLWSDIRPVLAVCSIPELHNHPSSKEISRENNILSQVASKLPTTKSEALEVLRVPSSRTMKESYIAIELPFKQQPHLAQLYQGCDAVIRIGKLLEDIDTLACMIAHKHCLPTGASPDHAQKIGLILITAAVDRIDMIRPLHSGEAEDLKLSGHVLHTTTSALEILVKVSAVGSEENKTVMIARVIMVARDMETGVKRTIPSLLPALDDPSEQSLAGVFSHVRAKRHVPQLPVEKPLDLVHDRFRPTSSSYDLISHPLVSMTNSVSDLHMKAVRCTETRLSDSAWCHPQKRNLYGAVFGGYLMRLAYENAFCAASLFAQKPVELVSLDNFEFKSSVEVGALLQLTSEITRINDDELGSIQVYVQINSTNMMTGKSKISNRAYLTFKLVKSEEAVEKFVIPQTDGEAQRWLEGERRALSNIGMRNLVLQTPLLL